MVGCLLLVSGCTMHLHYHAPGKQSAARSSVIDTVLEDLESGNVQETVQE